MRERTSARDIAHQIIRERIINLDLKPNEMLDDRKLAEEMGMSRTPVREALIMLSMAGLVVVRPQSGTFVAPIDLQAVDMEQFARFTMEKEVLTRMCRREKGEYENYYEENVYLYEFYKHSSTPGKAEKLMELDNEFHRIAFAADGKDEYFRVLLGRLQHIERLRILSLQLLGVDERILNDHRKIVDAVQKRDIQEAEYWLEVHLKRYQENLSAMMERYPDYFEGRHQ